MTPWSSFRIQSEKNGTIVVKRWFGKPEIEVDGYVQSGEYMMSLWSEALWRARPQPMAKSVLLLGLGCGSSIQVVQSRFPECDITAIDWDPYMVELAETLNWFEPSPKIQVICGDAFDILPQLTKRFDLVLVDLFQGDALEPRLSGKTMICAIAQVVNPYGQIIVNAFKNNTVFDAISTHLDCVQHWRFQNNWLALFQLCFPYSVNRHFDDNFMYRPLGG